MKHINLISLIESVFNIPENLIGPLLGYYGINLRRDELLVISDFILTMGTNTPPALYDGFYVGYSIPQIGKEFDLLRFGTNHTINVEVKSTTQIDRIKCQLLQNRYYLSVLGVPVKSYTFVQDTKTLYYLDDKEKLSICSTDHLYECLNVQELNRNFDISVAFNSSSFLVSPFNNTDRFLAGEYFLTNHQAEIRTECISLLNQESCELVSLSGEAGTGKTLLAYDIALELSNSGQKILIVHCGLMNAGHLEIIAKTPLRIIPIKNLSGTSIENYGTIIIDEAQRLRSEQLNFLFEQSSNYRISLLFSLDGRQYLQSHERKRKIPDKILNKTGLKCFSLTNTIRTNQSIALFIKYLFNANEKVNKMVTNCVNIDYYKSSLNACEAIKRKMELGVKIINFTPSQYTVYPYDSYHIDQSETVHEIIGQEFEEVAVIIDKYFYYENGELSTQGWRHTPYYHPSQMLYQILTRTKSRLHIVIIDNPVILNRCLEVIGR